MDNVRISVIPYFYFCLLTASYSQDAESSGYVILSIEQTHTISQHGTRTYFWIIPVDSIKPNGSSTIARLFLSGFTADNLEDCCSGKPIDPSIVFGNSSFTLETDYQLGLRSLMELVLKNRRKVQKIQKKWKDQTETIVVFATPVLGQFCSSDFHEIGQHRTGYRGEVYIPKSSFRNYDMFWSSPKANNIVHHDFSTLDIDIIPN